MHPLTEKDALIVGVIDDLYELHDMVMVTLFHYRNFAPNLVFGGTHVLVCASQTDAGVRATGLASGVHPQELALRHAVDDLDGLHDRE